MKMWELTGCWQPQGEILIREFPLVSLQRLVEGVQGVNVDVGREDGFFLVFDMKCILCTPFFSYTFLLPFDS